MKLRSTQSRGFTLIELLVVVTIIGLLASVVLVSLGSARLKGVDATIKAQLHSAQEQDELYATSNTNNYSGVCAASQSSSGLGGSTSGILVAALSAVAGKGGAVNVTLATAGQWNNVSCHDTATSWMVEAPLSASTSGVPSLWCVDSNGSAKVEPAAMLANATSCV